MWVVKGAQKFVDIIQKNVAIVRIALPLPLPNQSFDGHNKQSLMFSRFRVN